MTGKLIDIVCAYLSFVLGGCVILHTYPISSDCTGSVAEAVTLRPIVGARVGLVDKPSAYVLTDKAGRFYLPSRRAFQLTVPWGPCPDDLLEGRPYLYYLSIRYAGYQNEVVDTRALWDPVQARHYPTNILLKPVEAANGETIR